MKIPALEKIYAVVQVMIDNPGEITEVFESIANFEEIDQEHYFVFEGKTWSISKGMDGTYDFFFYSKNPDTKTLGGLTADEWHRDDFEAEFSCTEFCSDSDEGSTFYMLLRALDITVRSRIEGLTESLDHIISTYGEDAQEVPQVQSEDSIAGVVDSLLPERE